MAQSQHTCIDDVTNIYNTNTCSVKVKSLIMNRPTRRLPQTIPTASQMTSILNQMKCHSTYWIQLEDSCNSRFQYSVQGWPWPVMMKDYVVNDTTQFLFMFQRHIIQWYNFILIFWKGEREHLIQLNVWLINKSFRVCSVHIFPRCVTLLCYIFARNLHI